MSSPSPAATTNASVLAVGRVTVLNAVDLDRRVGAAAGDRDRVIAAGAVDGDAVAASPRIDRERTADVA